MTLTFKLNGEAELIDNNVIYAGPPLAFNKDNVDYYDF